MRGEILKKLPVQISWEINFGLGQRIVAVNPLGPRWDDIELANHNVFRLSMHNEVVWQVCRAELPGSADWPEKHALAKRWKRDGVIDEAYTAQGFLDPFTSMHLDERQAISPRPQGTWRPGCVVHLMTRWTIYALDPQTGVATCTGDQIN